MVLSSVKVSALAADHYALVLFSQLPILKFIQALVTNSSSNKSYGTLLTAKDFTIAA